VDLGIFKYLVRAKSPVTLQSLVDSTGSEAALLERLMRALASIHAVKETNDGLYEVSKISEAFAGTKGDAGARLL
jgi:demethylsterigmatocystin 6-O-methyltransferase